MKTPILIIVITFFCTGYVYSQNDSRDLKKIDFSINIFDNFLNKDLMPNGATYTAQQILLTTYPIKHRSFQYGFAFGFENIRTKKVDSLIYHETRIPFLFSNKFYLSKNLPIYIETQFGTALTMKSVNQNEIQEEFKNAREDVSLPIIVNSGLGFEFVSEHDISIGLEIGYAYKQLGFNKENRYDNAAFYIGLFVSIP